ncbi:hypothetical protein EVAR_98416_1 [Eumeta japonica]|uniref:Uncharacterized protein n=1 Tax=Eumeta variegata TaxID=151549 RepID=A0A4C2AHP5_EUMVA|nr:hypothetical protein EVAR_98416_1 [Eumeta japonica]
MDNAPYHSVVVNKTPTMSTTKAEMQNWIVSKGLSYLPTMVKAQLFEIIQETRSDQCTKLTHYWSSMGIVITAMEKECEHVKNIEENYFRDGVLVDEIDRFIIEVGGDETDTSDSENRDTDSSNIRVWQGSWLASFRKRHKNLSKPDNTSAARSIGFNKTAVNDFFLENVYRKHNFTADRIFNYESDPSSNASLLSLTCHGIASDFERSSIILKCETFDDRHTGDIIAEKFDTMLSEWNISNDQVHCMIRDEGSNMKTMRLAKLQTWIVQFIRCNLPFEISRNTEDILASRTISPSTERAKTMKMTDSMDTDTERPETSGTGRQSCLISDDLVMILDSSSDDESQKTPEINSLT